MATYDENKLVKLGALKQVAEKLKEAQDASILGVKVNGTALSVAADQTVNIPIVEGATNGAVSVNGADVPVHGLDALAYKSEVGTSDLATELVNTISAKAANSTVNTLIGSDAGKSVREIANEELAAQLIPQDAKESLNTLQEIAAWIQDHPDEASAINAKLTLGKHEVDGQQVEYGTVKAYVEAMTSGLIKLDALSVVVTGEGNAVTAASYDSATGVLTLTKGTAFVESSRIATDAEVTEMLTEVFGAA